MIRLQAPKPSDSNSLRRLRWRDRKRKASQGPPQTQRAERDFARQLRDIGQHVGELIAGFEPGEISAVPTLQTLLERYAEALTPWAERTVSRMLLEVDGRDRERWRALGNEISLQLHRDIENAPVGERLRELLTAQVGLIKSIPIEAGERVHKLTVQGLEDSTRAREYVEEIKSRAMLIARTEVARTASILTRVRAEAAGSTSYIWETSRDSTVRPGHRAMQGKVCRWDDPPAVEESDGVHHEHPGSIWNCRCWARPIVELDSNHGR
jgi:SPP1 gp7 family putative phage head morphogenesis protein